MKRIIAVVLTILMLASLTVNAAEIKFSDVAETDKSYEAIYKLVNAGVLVGDGDGTFRPNDGLTRAEFCKIINLIFNYKDEAETNFSDVKETDWFYKEVLIAKKAGYIAGYGDDTFRGNNMLTREETCVIISRVANLYKLPYSKTIKDEVSSWAKEYVEKVLSNRLMSLEEGDIFRATEKITRAEMAMVSANFVEEKAEIEEPKKEEEPKKPVKPVAGGGGGGGGSTTTILKENEQMVSSLNSVINSFKVIEFTADEQKIIDKVLIYVKDALVKAKTVVLTNEYIRETYAKQIEEAKADLYAMPDEEEDAFVSKVIRKVEDEAYEFLLDFFFPEEETEEE